MRRRLRCRCCTNSVCALVFIAAVVGGVLYGSSGLDGAVSARLLGSFQSVDGSPCGSRVANVTLGSYVWWPDPSVAALTVCTNTCPTRNETITITIPGQRLFTLQTVRSSAPFLHFCIPDKLPGSTVAATGTGGGGTGAGVALTDAFNDLWLDVTHVVYDNGLRVEAASGVGLVLYILLLYYGGVVFVWGALLFLFVGGALLGTSLLGLPPGRALCPDCASYLGLPWVSVVLGGVILLAVVLYVALLARTSADIHFTACRIQGSAATLLLLWPLQPLLLVRAFILVIILVWFMYDVTLQVALQPLECLSGYGVTDGLTLCAGLSSLPSLSLVWLVGAWVLVWWTLFTFSALGDLLTARAAYTARAWTLATTAAAVGSGSGSGSGRKRPPALALVCRALATVSVRHLGSAAFGAAIEVLLLVYRVLYELLLRHCCGGGSGGNTCTCSCRCCCHCCSVPLSDFARFGVQSAYAVVPVQHKGVVDSVRYIVSALINDTSKVLGAILFAELVVAAGSLFVSLFSVSVLALLDNGSITFNGSVTLTLGFISWASAALVLRALYIIILTDTLSELSGAYTEFIDDDAVAVATAAAGTRPRTRQRTRQRTPTSSSDTDTDTDTGLDESDVHRRRARARAPHHGRQPYVMIRKEGVRV